MKSTTKPTRLIKNLRMYIHGIPYITTYIVLQKIIVDSNFSMLLGRPTLRDAKVTHDWGNNMITIQGNGIV